MKGEGEGGGVVILYDPSVLLETRPKLISSLPGVYTHLGVTRGQETFVVIPAHVQYWSRVSQEFVHTRLFGPLHIKEVHRHVFTTSDCDNKNANNVWV